MSEKYMSIGAPMTELPVAQPRGYTSHSHRSLEGGMSGSKEKLLQLRRTVCNQGELFLGRHLRWPAGQSSMTVVTAEPTAAVTRSVATGNI